MNAASGVTPDAISGAYCGKSNRCCCGCAGTHYSEHDATDVRRILRRIQSSETVDVADDGSHVALDTGRKLYIVYFHDSFRLPTAKAAVSA